MDTLPYVDTLFKEYLLFRGFTSTLLAFGAELEEDATKNCGFQAEAITELLFRRLIPGPAEQLLEFLEYLNMGLYSRLDSSYEPLVSAVEADLLRLFLVTAHAARQPDKISDFFRLAGSQLLASSAEWAEWFVLPHLPHPEREPRFQVYFSAEWGALLEVSFRNFISSVVRSLPLPAVLRFNTDRRLRQALQQQVVALQAELDRTKQQLADASASLLQLQQQQHDQRQAGVGTAPHPPQPQHSAVAPGTVAGSTAVAGSTGAPPAAAGVAAAAAAAGAAATSTLHRREASLDAWQSQELQRAGSSGRRAGHVGTLARGNADRSSVEGQELRVIPPESRLGGSALFELLPPAHIGAAAGGGEPGGLQQQHQLQPRPPHGRTGSVGGGISFDAHTPCLAGVAARTDSDDAEPPPPPQPQQQAPPPPPSQQQEQQQAQQQEQVQQQAEGPRAIPTSAPLPGEVGPSASPEPSPRTSGSSASSAVLSSSPPVLSWAGGSAAGWARSHLPPGTTSGASGAGQQLVLQGPPAQLLVLQPSPARAAVTCVTQQHAPAAAGAAGGVGAVAFSPSGANVASACAGGSVAIWQPPGLPGNAARAAHVACGAPVTCVAWDVRADKLMFIGCAAGGDGGGGGVRAWHADTRRIMHSVPAEPGHPAVVSIAACPSEPTFVVAANSSSSGGDEQARTPLTGRLATYNARSFKRSGLLVVPGDVGLASVAYSSSGAQLLVGTASGTALLYEPASRSSPLWHLQAAMAPGTATAAAGAPSGTSEQPQQPVLVMWRPLPGGSSASGTVLTLCGGVLCEWSLAGGTSSSSSSSSSGSAGRPVCTAALDIVATAAAALQEPGDGELAGPWCCHAAVSPDGGRVAVLCGCASAGVLLLFPAPPSSGQPWRASPAVLLSGPSLARGGVVSWHPGGRALVLGCASAPSCSIAVSLAAPQGAS